MHFQQDQSAGPAVNQTSLQPSKPFVPKSSSLPFGQDLPLASIGGPTYLTAQTLVQQVAYALSDRIFAYSPETFDLDVAVQQWQAEAERNAWGHNVGVSPMETRTGAGNIALGYIFSRDFDVKKRHIPQGIIASTASLVQLRASLDRLALHYPVANPLVAHIAAVDYSAGSSNLVTDYCSALAVAEDVGMGLVSSASAHEVQHMSLFATVMAGVLPSIHIYDGVNVGRETTRVIDVLDKSSLHKSYQRILHATAGPEKRHSDDEGKVVRLMRAFNDELGTDYQLFEYHGHASPESVLVVFGTVEASVSAQVAKTLAKNGAKVGVINVRVYRPFVEDVFMEVLPKSVRKLAVLGQVRDRATVSEPDVHSSLYSDVLAAVTFSTDHARSLSVTDMKYARNEIWTPAKIAGILRKMTGSADESVVDLLENSVQQYTFWNLDDSPNVTAPLVLGQFISRDSATNVSVRTGRDNLVQSGVVRTDIRNSNRSIEAAYSVDSADLVFVGDEKLLGEFDIVNNSRTGGILVVRLPGAKDDDLEKKIPIGLRKGIVGKKLELFVVDPTASEVVSETPSLEPHLIELAFLHIAREDLFSKVVNKLVSLNGDMQSVVGLAAELGKTLRRIEYPESWATVEPEVESVSLPTDINVNSFSAFERVDPEPPGMLQDWVTAAKGFAFKEAYGTRSALRPDVGVKTAVVHVQEHRRLTPLTYDRNIFHIEFDLGDSGLTYNIGEALGIHAENDPHEVDEFIRWYGLQPDEIVEIPNRDDPTVLDNRTVYQALMQNVDIFGRPPKRFYESLADFATDDVERRNLLALGTAEGAIEFKRRAEVDTITFADVFAEFPSAHPAFHDLARLVSPMKRREYSIASAQKATPTSISLLIVTVGWVDSRGRDRFGQATRFLDRLPVGAPVTVSIKPSVMKLPASTAAPIIMAGLGTGLAPFRAFVQERALQHQQGLPIGPVMLYLGARHQREEYLYGEEWEAYRDAGVITLLGQAFSRDQPQKIYIQDRMRQTMDAIRKAYLKEEGSFYLCGPTWPVPDVTAVLQEAVEREAKEGVEAGEKKKKRVDSRKEIERLKDEGRYVLEVY